MTGTPTAGDDAGGQSEENQGASDLATTWVSKLRDRYGRFRDKIRTTLWAWLTLFGRGLVGARQWIGRTRLARWWGEFRPVEIWRHARTAPNFTTVVVAVAGFAAIALTLSETGNLLRRIDASGQHFGPSVFTGFTLKVGDTADLLAAVRVWKTDDASAAIAGELVSWHLLLDLLVFAPLLALLLAWGLRAAAASSDRNVDRCSSLPVTYLIADWAETAFTAVAMSCYPGMCALQVNDTTGALIHTLSLVKWVLLAANIVAILALLKPSNLREGLRRRGSGGQHPTGPPGGVVAVVVIFFVLVAVPGGQGLDQMPDVLRVEFDRVRDGDLGGPLLSAAALLAFIVLLYVCVAPSVEPTEAAPVGAGIVLLVSAATTLVLAVAYVLAEGRTLLNGAALPVLAPLLVIASLWALSAFTGWVRGVVGASDGPADPSAAISPVKERTRAARAAALVVAAAVLAGGLGGVRAVLPLVLVAPRLENGDIDTSTHDLALMVLIAAYLFTIAFAGLAAKRVSDRLARPTTNPPKVFRLACATFFVGFAAVLAVNPELAHEVGATGATVVALGFLAVVFAALGWLTRKVHWQDTSKLVRGTHTSWTAVLILVWLVASQLDFGGGYHDARTMDTPTASKGSTQRIRTLDDALSQWQNQVSAASETCLRGKEGARRMPLVLVAAPGGGARAMYWTVAGMDQVFTTSGAFCPQSLFAASGVSGGAVGLTARLATPPRKLATPTADAMAGQSSLASTIAAMLLRDLPQPFTGIRSSWRDRAAVLEDGWDFAANSFDVTTHKGTRSGPRTMEELGTAWWGGQGAPVLLLNGTSVVDGCRVLTGNIHGFTSKRKGCLDAPDADSNNTDPDDGTFSATIDVQAGLGPSTGAGSPADTAYPGEVCRDRTEQTLPILTGALLAARFPYVTPSGALRVCPPADADDQDVVTTTYVVDGGYLENTGLLSLGQAWAAIADRVTSCNRLVTAETRTGTAQTPCLTDQAGNPVLVEPWLVLLENHYGTERPPVRSERPRELFIPPATAFTKRSVTIGTVALEQNLAAEMGRELGGLKGCNRFVRLSPGSRPGVEAPLGWVLSSASKQSMSAGLAESWNAATGGEPLTDRCAEN